MIIFLTRAHLLLRSFGACHVALNRPIQAIHSRKQKAQVRDLEEHEKAKEQKKKFEPKSRSLFRPRKQMELFLSNIIHHFRASEILSFRCKMISFIHQCDEGEEK